jgi:hypothetical protein
VILDHRRLCYLMFAMVLSVAVVLTGCGGDSGATDEARPHSAHHLEGLSSLGKVVKGEPRAKIVGVMKGYLAAIAADDGGRACDFLYGPIATQLSTGQGEVETPGCPAAVGSLFLHQSGPARSALKHTHIRAVLLHGPQAFVVLTGAGQSEGFYPLQETNRGWKVAALGISSLPDPRSR